MFSSHKFVLLSLTLFAAACSSEHQSAKPSSIALAPDVDDGCPAATLCKPALNATTLYCTNFTGKVNKAQFCEKQDASTHMETCEVPWQSAALATEWWNKDGWGPRWDFACNPPKTVTQAEPSVASTPSLPVANEQIIASAQIGDILSQPACSPAAYFECHTQSVTYEEAPELEDSKCVVRPDESGVNACYCYPKGKPDWKVSTVFKSCDDGNAATVDTCNESWPFGNKCKHVAAPPQVVNPKTDTDGKPKSWQETLSAAKVGDIIPNENCKAYTSFCSEKDPTQFSYGYFVAGKCVVNANDSGKWCSCMEVGPDSIGKSGTCNDDNAATADLCIAGTGESNAVSTCTHSNVGTMMGDKAIACIDIPQEVVQQDVYACDMAASTTECTSGWSHSPFSVYVSMPGISKVPYARFCHVLPAGATSTYFTITLTNGKIVNKDAALSFPLQFEQVGQKFLFGPESYKDCDVDTGSSSPHYLAPKQSHKVCGVKSSNSEPSGFVVRWF